MKRFKVESNKKRKYFYYIIFKILFLSFLIIIGFTLYKGITDFYIIFKLSAGLLIFDFVLFIIPLSILYFNHIYFSKNITFSIDKVYKKYIYKNVDKIFEFDEDDLLEVTKVVTPSMYDNRTDWVFWGKYFYTLINLKNGKTIKLSCLLIEEIEDEFPNLKKKKIFFPIISSFAFSMITTYNHL